MALDEKINVESTNTEKPDLKQWIPICGLFETMLAQHNKKPYIFDDSSSKYILAYMYHLVLGSAAGAGIGIGIRCLEKIF